MSARLTRRHLLRVLGAASAAVSLPSRPKAEARGPGTRGREVEIRITPVSAGTFRLTILPLSRASEPVPNTGCLVRTDWGTPIVRLRGGFSRQAAKSGDFRIEISPDPLSFEISHPARGTIQRLGFDRETGALSFLAGDWPLLGLGEGGPQFDRRGAIDEMRNGQGGYKLATHGGRVPIPWIISTSGWALLVDQPSGTFDFTGSEAKFTPASADTALPLDLFFVGAENPGVIMAEYARLTGRAEMPPLWAFGYQQSHRTLASREEILEEARTFREKRLPCDALIYLGTGFCPSGWNTANGSFEWNSKVFPDPREMIDQLHQDNFRVVLHAVILTDKLQGSAGDRCELATFDPALASCYWDAHRKVFRTGVDGWWPDEGDSLDVRSRLSRNRMYWEGPQLDRPNERPFALHRNGAAGMQRYASFLWSGDVYSTWETLRTHVPIAINTGLSGIPYWGTDIGGFVPTKEFTAELYVRWFQFGAFSTLFRCHGRNWKLRLPWGWNTGDPGPIEISRYEGAALPDASELHNPEVEPVCRKYLELRYRMLPYLYSAVRECTLTGMPIMRALWLHYSGDREAVARADEYLWGRDLLVAPVVEKGARLRNLYLPQGAWYDFWTNQRLEGGRKISRKVDLETMPLYVRAGAILPLWPVKQHTGEKSDRLSIAIYPGEDGSFLVYEDDGKSFDYRRGEWMGLEIGWNDARRILSLRLAEGSKMLPPVPRKIEIRLDRSFREVEFRGKPFEVQL
ncbi:MAG: DUF5110 domain-containing protein [Acidobacteria bacterium]|nr:DUF5110 domain-containing protein [Acidobacteriota bacterium]